LRRWRVRRARRRSPPLAFEWRDDLPDFNPDKPETARQPLSLARQSDALVCVLRAFDSPYAPYHAPIDPARDLRFWLDEFVLSDLQVIENRLERLTKLFQSHKESAADRAEHALLSQMHAALSAGESLAAFEIPSDLEARLRGFGFLTRKPMVVVANIGESLLGDEARSEMLASLQAVCDAHGLPMMSLCATFERDLRHLPESEQAEFLQMMGVAEPALPRLVRLVYEQLHLQVVLHDWRRFAGVAAAQGRHGVGRGGDHPLRLGARVHPRGGVPRRRGVGGGRLESGAQSGQGAAGWQGVCDAGRGSDLCAV
jgi:hypothetical protein